MIPQEKKAATTVKIQTTISYEPAKVFIRLITFFDFSSMCAQNVKNLPTTTPEEKTFEQESAIIWLKSDNTVFVFENAVFSLFDRLLL